MELQQTKKTQTNLNLSYMAIIHPGCPAYMFLLVASQAKGGGTIMMSCP